MKSASTVLIALTVFTLFLGSTASIIPDAVDNIKGSIAKTIKVVDVSDEDKLKTEELIKSSEAALKRMNEIIADPNMTSGIDEFSLEKTKLWMTTLGATSTVLHTQIRAVEASGSVALMKATVFEIQGAITVNKGILSEFNKKVPPGDFKDGINEGIEEIIEDANNVKIILNKNINK